MAKYTGNKADDFPNWKIANERQLKYMFDHLDETNILRTSDLYIRSLRLNADQTYMDGSNYTSVNLNCRYMEWGSDGTADKVRTNNTTKLFAVGACHYSNSTEEPVASFYQYNTATGNQVTIGGGISFFNAATDIFFATAPNNTTVTGSNRARITGAGDTRFFYPVMVGGSGEATTRFEVEETKLPYVYIYNNSTGAYTNRITQFGNSTANDVAAPPIQGVEDAIYFGNYYKFDNLLINVGTAGVYTATLVWEYWNGSAWATLTATDGTSGFTVAGGNSVTYALPGTWARYPLDIGTNVYNLYWIRCRCSAFTSITTAPLISYGRFVTTDDFAGAITQDPGYTATYATRHNYRRVENLSVSNSSAVNGCLEYFDAVAGTHRVIDTNTGILSVINATPTAAGSGYKANDILEVTTGGICGTVQVSTVDASGGVTALVTTPVTTGSGYTAGTGKATSGGFGSGCTVDITTVKTTSNVNSWQKNNVSTTMVYIPQFAQKVNIALSGEDASLVIGNGAAGIDYTLTFDGETSDGVLTWMEDEDYFQFSDDILMSSTEKVQFRDAALYISSKDDGHLDIDADTSIDLNGLTLTQNVQPLADDTYYLGKNDDDSPLAYKGVILKDTTDGKYYRIEVISGVVTATDLTD